MWLGIRLLVMNVPISPTGVLVLMVGISETISGVFH